MFDLIIFVLIAVPCVLVSYTIIMLFENVLYRMPINRIIQTRLCRLTCDKAKKQLKILELSQSEDENKDSKIAKLNQELFTIDMKIKELKDIELKKTSKS